MPIHVETIILLIKPKIPIPIADENNYTKWVSSGVYRKAVCSLARYVVHRQQHQQRKSPLRV